MKLANRRIRLVLAVFAFAFAAMFLRAAWLQGVNAGSYERLASGQHKATIVDHASRGTIFDRTGVQLAIGRQATTVYANPRQIQNPQSTAELVARVLRLDPDKVLSASFWELLREARANGTPRDEGIKALRKAVKKDLGRGALSGRRLLDALPSRA